MTAILEAGRLDGRICVSELEFRVDFVEDWKLVEARWSAAPIATAFQNPHWLASWYEAFATAEPLIAVITDRVNQRPIALIPLIRRTSFGIRIIEFADLNVTDY